jgi:hypothetical protein
MKNLILSLILVSFLIYSSCRRPDKEETELKESKLETKSDTIKPESNYSGWEKYSIKGFGEISIPPEMEIQSGKFKKQIEKYRELNGLSGEQIVFQQKGLNSFEDDAENSYARVMIKTIISPSEGFGNLYNISIYDIELKEYDNEYKNEMAKNLKKQNIKITEWYPIHIAKVNRMQALLTSYNRKMGNNPEAFVRMYQFFNIDRHYFVTLSYRVSEKEKWESLFENILKSIKINKFKKVK